MVLFGSTLFHTANYLASLYVGFVKKAPSKKNIADDLFCPKTRSRSALIGEETRCDFWIRDKILIQGKIFPDCLPSDARKSFFA